MSKKFNANKYLISWYGMFAVYSTLFTFVTGIVMSLGSFMFYLAGMVGIFQSLFTLGIMVMLVGYFGLMWFLSHDKKKGEW